MGTPISRLVFIEWRLVLARAIVLAAISLVHCEGICQVDLVQSRASRLVSLLAKVPSAKTACVCWSYSDLKNEFTSEPNFFEYARGAQEDADRFLVTRYGETYIYNQGVFYIISPGASQVDSVWLDENHAIARVDHWVPPLFLNGGRNILRNISNSEVRVSVEDTVLFGEPARSIYIRNPSPHTDDSLLRQIDIRYFAGTDGAPLGYSIAFYQSFYFSYGAAIVRDQFVPVSEREVDSAIQATLRGHTFVSEATHDAEIAREYVPNKGHFDLGAIVPDFDGTDSAGTHRRLYEENPAATLLDFAFISCAPCHEMIPTLQAVSSEFHDRGLRVLSVDPQDDLGSLARFTRRSRIHYECWKVDRETSSAYGVTAFPTLYLLDRSHRIVWYSSGYGPNTASALHSALAKLLE